MLELSRKSMHYNVKAVPDTFLGKTVLKQFWLHEANSNLFEKENRENQKYITPLYTL